MQRRSFLRSLAPIVPAAPVALASVASSDQVQAAAALAQQLGPDGLITLGTIGELRELNPQNAKAAFVLGYHSPADLGGGPFVWNASSTSDDNGGTVIASIASSSGRWIRVAGSAMPSVRWFGAKGDERTDDTKAIAAALAAIDGPVFVPAGKYRITDSIVLRKSQSGLVGEGQKTQVRMDDGANKPIIRVGDTPGKSLYYLRLEYLRLEYPKDQGNTQQGAIGILIDTDCGFCQVRNVAVWRCYGGLQTNKKAQHRVSFFSATIDTFAVRRFSGFGIDYEPIRTGDSGSIWSNIYLNNGRRGTKWGGRCKFYMRVTKCGTFTINQLNIEHGSFTARSAVSFGRMRSATVTSFHIELVRMGHAGPNASIISFTHPTANVRLQGVFFRMLHIPGEGIGANPALFNASVSGVRANISNVHAEESLIDASDLELVRIDKKAGHDTFLDFEQVDLDFADKLSAFVSGGKTSMPAVQRFSDAEYYVRRAAIRPGQIVSQEHPGNVFTLNSNEIPRHGVFDRGTLVLKTDGVSIGSNIGWIAREGGGAHQADWDKGTTYTVNDWVRGSDRKIYRSVAERNVGNAPGGSKKWIQMAEQEVIWEPIVTHLQNAGPPSSGEWDRGAIVWNADPTAGGHAGWICVAGGEPGTWKPFGDIAK